MGNPEDNAPLAICLTLAAGMCTVLGATLVFCVPPDRFEALPIALAFSAGVMVYVSMTEILPESKEGFASNLEESNPDSAEYLSHIFTSLCFFGGILLGYGLDFVTHLMGYDDHDMATPRAMKTEDPEIEMESQKLNTDENATAGASPANGQHVVEMPDHETAGKGTLDRPPTEEENKQLVKSALITALAIGIHNFPEGLATFVGTLADPELGISIAVAIAIHNIPEGVAVAMPIYFGTGSRWKAVMWAFISGIAEPIGGLIGWALIKTVINDAVYGVLFGITAGIMVYISMKELLPTARRKDFTDKYVSILLFVGFLVMDISIILFEI